MLELQELANRNLTQHQPEPLHAPDIFTRGDTRTEQRPMEQRHSVAFYPHGPFEVSRGQVETRASCGLTMKLRKFKRRNCRHRNGTCLERLQDKIVGYLQSTLFNFGGNDSSGSSRELEKWTMVESTDDSMHLDFARRVSNYGSESSGTCPRTSRLCPVLVLLAFLLGPLLITFSSVSTLYMHCPIDSIIQRDR